jgi:hypothetical protein
MQTFVNHKSPPYKKIIMGNSGSIMGEPPHAAQLGRERTPNG